MCNTVTDLPVADQGIMPGQEMSTPGQVNPAVCLLPIRLPVCCLSVCPCAARLSASLLLACLTSPFHSSCLNMLVQQCG